MEKREHTIIHLDPVKKFYLHFVVQAYSLPCLILIFTNGFLHLESQTNQGICCQHSHLHEKELSSMSIMLQVLHFYSSSRATSASAYERTTVLMQNLREEVLDKEQPRST